MHTDSRAYCRSRADSAGSSSGAAKVAKRLHLSALGVLGDESALHGKHRGVVRLLRRVWRTRRALERVAEWYFQTRWVQLMSLYLTGETSC